MKSSLVDILSILLIILGGYIVMVNIPEKYIYNLLGGDKVYLHNRLLLEKDVNQINIVYFDQNKNKLQFSYNVDINNNKPNIINKNNFFNFFKYKGELLYINIIKRQKGQDIDKVFSSKLDTNNYVGYYDEERNNLYIFAHNGTNNINGGRIFYYLKEGETINFINSLLNFSSTKRIDGKYIVSKKIFIKDFINNTGIFGQKNKIYFITCYPNYQSSKRLILVLDNVKEDDSLNTDTDITK